MDMPKKDIYNDVWFFYKKYIELCKYDERWGEIINEAEKITKKHNKDKFAIGLINAVIDELGRLQKG